MCCHFPIDSALSLLKGGMDLAFPRMEKVSSDPPHCPASIITSTTQMRP